jgi:hypothetical protein
MRHKTNWCVWLLVDYGFPNEIAPSPVRKWNLIATFHANDWCLTKEEAKLRFPEVVTSTEFRLLPEGKKPSRRVR